MPSRSTNSRGPRKDIPEHLDLARSSIDGAAALLTKKRRTAGQFASALNLLKQAGKAIDEIKEMVDAGRLFSRVALADTNGSIEEKRSALFSDSLQLLKRNGFPASNDTRLRVVASVYSRTAATETAPNPTAIAADVEREYPAVHRSISRLVKDQFLVKIEGHRYMLTDKALKFLNEQA